MVEGDILGQHKSPMKGASVEFTEHRQYHPGDEIRHIDWRAYGKTGKYFVKEFEDETNLRCQLLVDVPPSSMAYGDSTLSKFDYARQLAAALAYLLLAQRDAVGLTVFDDHVRTRLAPSTQQALFAQVTDALESRLEPTDESSSAVRRRRRRIAWRGVADTLTTKPGRGDQRFSGRHRRVDLGPGPVSAMPATS